MRIIGRHYKAVMDTAKSAKSVLRKNIQNVIDKISEEEKIRQSKIVFDKILNLSQFQLSERVSVYLSTENEINTIPILTHLLESGKQVFVPRYSGKSMTMLKLHSLDDYNNLPLTKWMIKQPDSTDRENALQTGGLDLIILPGVAFTKAGKRLGHGMGYYDKYINNYHKCEAVTMKKPYLVGVCFNEQIVNDLPTTENDVMLDMVISENKTL